MPYICIYLIYHCWIYLDLYYIHSLKQTWKWTTPCVEEHRIPGGRVICLDCWRDSTLPYPPFTPPPSSMPQRCPSGTGPVGRAARRTSPTSSWPGRRGSHKAAWVWRTEAKRRSSYPQHTCVRFFVGGAGGCRFEAWKFNLFRICLQ